MLLGQAPSGRVPGVFSCRLRAALRGLVLLLVARTAWAQAPEPVAVDQPGFTPPALLVFVPATLPSELEGQEADVVLRLDVDEKGEVRDARVEQSAGPGFDAAALAAVRKFRFAPARLGTELVPAQVTYRYRFVLQSAPPAVPAPAPSPGGEPMQPLGPGPALVPFAGTILSRGDRRPLSDVDVALDEGGETTQSDASGRFVFAAVPVGPHVAHLRGPEIGAFDARVTLHAGKRLDVTYYVTLNTSAQRSYRTTVRGRRVVQEAVEQTIPIEEVKRIPGTNGDTLKAVQNLPGVARPPFGGGLLVVWGSAPGDTRTYVDGVYIPTLFHFSGLRSTVNSELVAGLSLLPGGFGAEYGRGLGGAIEIQSRAPRTDGYHGFAQIDVIDLSGSIEGRITKKLSFAVAGRISWLHLFLRRFLTSDVQSSPRYWDYQARFRWQPTPKDDVDVFIFGSDDRLKLLLKDDDPTLTQSFDTHTYYHRALGRWTRRFGRGASFVLTPSIGYDLPYNLGVGLGSLPFLIQNGQLQYSVRALVTLPLRRWLRLETGVDYEGTRYFLNAVQNLNGGLREGDNGGFGGLGGPDAAQGVARDRLVLLTNHVAPHAGLTFSLLGNRLVLRPQVRLELLNFLGYPGEARRFSGSAVLPEPRLLLRWQAHARVAVTGATGVYHQPPASPDLSSVFGSTRLGPQFGLHYVLGVEVRPTKTLSIDVKGFYKDLRSLVVRGVQLGDAALENEGVGRIYGGELLLKQALFKNFFGWISYTFSRSERRDHPGQPWRRFQYDQPHVLTVIGSYKLPRGVQVGVRFRYASGNPYTPVARAYYDVNSDSYMPIYGPTYSARLPAFHQLDLRVDKEFVFNRWKLLLYLDIQNLYARRAAETVVYNYNFQQQTYVTGLPFLPVLGVRGEF